MPKATMITIILCCFFDRTIYLTLAITFGTTTYHLAVRLLVGLIYNTFMQNQVDYTQKWFRIHLWEE